MCRPSRINPKLSAYQQVWGNFDFNKTPLAPPGCKVVVHERAMERGAWACHGIVGYYIEPAMHHYRNYNSYIPETKGIRTTNTLEFFPDKVDMPTTSPDKVDMPTTSSTDRLARATEDLAEILQQTHPATPFLQQGTVINDAMEQLSKIFSPPTRTKSALKNARSRQARTKSVRFTLPTTAWERLMARLGTKSARNNARPSGLRTKLVRRIEAYLRGKTYTSIRNYNSKKV
jgi:hypothetical protein